MRSAETMPLAQKLPSLGLSPQSPPYAKNERSFAKPSRFRSPTFTVAASNQNRTPSSPGPRPPDASSAPLRARAYTPARRIVPLNSRVGLSVSVPRERGAVLTLGRRVVVRVAFASPST